VRVAVIGSGYVGLVTGACLAGLGHDVTCVDVDPEKVRRINAAEPPIHEAGLPELLARTVGRSLRATTDLAAAVRDAELTMIAVGTPFDGTAIDLTAVREAARRIGEALRDADGYHVVVVKSTVVPGTTEDVVRPILEAASGRRAGADFGVGMNPEFLREGSAVEDFLAPDRLVLGGIDERSRDAMATLYAGFAGVDVVRTTPRTAEMIKYASNSLLATMISFANEIGNVCAATEGVDVVEVMRGVLLDRRQSPILADGTRVVPGATTYLQAGCGFGGSCFPKDVRALIAYAASAGAATPLLEAVMEVNREQPHRVVAMLRRHFPSLRGVRVAVLGLAFKPGTDDVRESPAIPVVRALVAEGAAVRAYDPIATQAAARVLADAPVALCDDLGAAIDDAQAIVLLTSWDEFRALPGRLYRREPQPVVVDGRRLLARDSVSRYEGIGLGI